MGEGATRSRPPDFSPPHPLAASPPLFAFMPTSTRASLFRVTVAVDEDRLRRMKHAPDAAAAAVRAGAEYWHDRVLPRHFEPEAHGKYHYAPRALTYLENRGKRGKPDLVFSGSLRSDLISRAAYKETGRSTIELRLTARVLNLVPNMPQNSADLYVKHNGGRGYPNLKREIKAITDDEREAVAQVIAGTFERALAPSSARQGAD